jgi:hypothetical protein
VSADNYYVVRKHPDGGFTFVMGFDSDSRPDREPTFQDPWYDDVWKAWNATGWSEYGTTFHPECEDALRNYWDR